MDGVYLDNSSISPGLNTVSRAAQGGSQSNQDNPSNRLADINPEDIENVEILKGASAAAIYGSRASGGVLLLQQERKKGKPQITLSRQWHEPCSIRWVCVTGIHKKYLFLPQKFLSTRLRSAGKIYNYEDIL
jgi:TonB-dependent SusC/RagA subfamily outer membrane receptor